MTSFINPLKASIDIPNHPVYKINYTHPWQNTSIFLAADILLYFILFHFTSDFEDRLKTSFQVIENYKVRQLLFG